VRCVTTAWLLFGNRDIVSALRVFGGKPKGAGKFGFPLLDVRRLIVSSAANRVFVQRAIAPEWLLGPVGNCCPIPTSASRPTFEFHMLVLNPVLPLFTPRTFSDWHCSTISVSHYVLCCSRTPVLRPFISKLPSVRSITSFRLFLVFRLSS